MSKLTLKQILLSEDNISKLRLWSERCHLSEAKLVRRAIQAYQPRGCASFSKIRKKLVLAMLAHIKESLASAIAVVDTTNAEIDRVLSNLAME